MTWWRRWVAFLSRREDGASLAACRIVAATTVCGHLAWMWKSGVAMGVWVDRTHGGMRSLDAGWLGHVGGLTPFNVHALLLLGILASASMAAGLFTRVACIATWLAFRTLTGINDHCGGASDDLLVNTLFLLMLSACGTSWSLDARRRSAAGEASGDGLVPAWPRYLLVLQLVLMYWMTALQKVSIGWIPGGPLDALWFILQQPTWQRASMRWLAPLYPLTQAATLATWIFEQSAPLFLLACWFRLTRERAGRLRAWSNRVDARGIYLAIGLVLHIGIFFTMEVGPFLGAVLALYACCIAPGEWNAIAARVARRVRPETNPAPAPAHP
jgi:hypothetical protein